MADTIVYTVVSRGGGMDGMDHTDKGGKVMWAGLDKEKVPVHYLVDGWYKTEATVVDLKNHAYDVVRGLSPVDRLALALHVADALNYYGGKP